MEALHTADASYLRSNMDALTEAGDAVSSAQDSSSRGFTAINRMVPQLGTSDLSPATPRTQQNEPMASRSSRRRNPTVASYLGLSALTEPVQLTECAPAPNFDSSPPLVTRKCHVAGTCNRKSTMETSTCPKRKAPTSESISQPVGHKFEGSGGEPLPVPASTLLATGRQINQKVGSTDGLGILSSITPPIETCREYSTVSDDAGDEFGQLCFDFEPKAPSTNETSCGTQSSEYTRLTGMQSHENDFDDDLVDDDFIDLDPNAMNVISCTDLQPSSSLKIVTFRQMQISSLYAKGTEALDGKADGVDSPSEKFKSPVTLTTPLLAPTSHETRVPFVRPAFPTGTRDRSPIIGLSSNVLLRTCFRVGEAINQSCQAATTSTNIVIELYARVLSSERDDLQQRFTFCDLFHTRPPYIQATYAAAIWKSVRLFEYDSARLLQQGRICRCMGSMKRNGKNWTMTVLNIWEATWDDVEWVQGIVQS